MTETLRRDIDRLWIACKTMKRHLKNPHKGENDKKLLEQDLKNLMQDASQLNLIMHHDEFTPEKIGDARIVEKFKQENDIVAQVRMAVGPLVSRRDFVISAVYNHDERAIQEIMHKLDSLMDVLEKLRVYNEELMNVIKEEQKRLKTLEKHVA